MFRRRARRIRAFLVFVVLVALLGFLASYLGVFTFLAQKFLYPVHFENFIEQSCERHGVNSYLAAAIIKSESSWNKNAVSRTGAQGLMQLMPATAREVAHLGLVDTKRYSETNLFDPATNIEYGCAYLSYLQKHAHSLKEVIAAYNAGPTRAKSWLSEDASDLKDVKIFPETKAYLSKVFSTFQKYQDLYPKKLSEYPETSFVDRIAELGKTLGGFLVPSKSTGSATAKNSIAAPVRYLNQYLNQALPKR